MSWPTKQEQRSLAQVPKAPLARTNNEAKAQPKVLTALKEAHIGSKSKTSSKYLVGVAAGCFVVHLAKKFLRSLPGLGNLLSPVLGLVPTTVAGPLLGAALVYNNEMGDRYAAWYLAKDVWDDLKDDADVSIREFKRASNAQLERQRPRVERLQRQLQDQMDFLETNLTPILERQYLHTKRQLAAVDKLVNKSLARQGSNGREES